jgi:hypothetical protein
MISKPPTKKKLLLTEGKENSGPTKVEEILENILRKILLKLSLTNCG